MPFPLVPLIGIAGQLIDKLIPDPEANAKAKLELANLEQKGELDEIELQLSAIIVEAKSQDAWTSRARPSFLYVVYLYILAAIPFGLLFAFHPPAAKGVTEGVALWLEAIPGEMWTLFGVGYLGYTGARTLEKRKILEGKTSTSKNSKIKALFGG